MEWWVWALLIFGGLMLVAWRWPRQFAAAGDALSAGGERMQRLGWGLTLAVTVPILGLIFFGVVGLIVGGIIGLLFGVGMIGQALSGEKPKG